MTQSDFFQFSRFYNWISLFQFFFLDNVKIKIEFVIFWKPVGFTKFIFALKP